MNVPVAIVFFNRLEPLKKLVARLEEIRPPCVYLISDGARRGKVGEEEKVAACRDFMRKLTWPCEVVENFAEENLGCRKRVTSGLDWVFEREERAIILEDDCIPVKEFFSWVEKMLDLYAADSTVLSICGTNYQECLSDEQYDVTATKYPVFTGWATWRRAWKLNDYDLSQLERARSEHRIRKWLGSWREEIYWLYLLAHVESSWGYRWSFTNFMNEGLQILPQRNLIDNVGINNGPSTHTDEYLHHFPSANSSWRYQGRIPEKIVSNKSLDQWFANTFYSKSLSERVKWVCRKLMMKGRRCYG